MNTSERDLEGKVEELFGIMREVLVTLQAMANHYHNAVGSDSDTNRPYYMNGQYGPGGSRDLPSKLVSSIVITSGETKPRV